MTDGPPTGIFVAFFVIAAIFIVIGILASQAEKRRLEQRRAELASLAERLGLQIMPFGLSSDDGDGGFLSSLFSWNEQGPDDRFLAYFQGFRPFGLGHSQTVPLLMAGRIGEVDWMLFDYEYKITTSTGKSTTTTTYRPSIAAARLPLSLPWLDLSLENFMTHLGERLGIHDVHFESEDFNKTYRVSCQDKKAAYDLLHPQAIEYLLRMPPREWQFGGPFLLLRTDRWAEPMEYLRMKEDIEGFVELIPGYLKEDRGIPSTPGPLEGIAE